MSDASAAAFHRRARSSGRDQISQELRDLRVSVVITVRKGGRVVGRHGPRDDRTPEPGRRGDPALRILSPQPAMAGGTNTTTPGTVGSECGAAVARYVKRMGESNLCQALK